jgi:hypothetical protein
LVERAVTVAQHEGLAKTAESVVISSGIPFRTQEQKVRRQALGGAQLA